MGTCDSLWRRPWTFVVTRYVKRHLCSPSSFHLTNEMNRFRYVHYRPQRNLDLCTKHETVLDDRVALCCIAISQLHTSTYCNIFTYDSAQGYTRILAPVWYCMIATCKTDSHTTSDCGQLCSKDFQQFFLVCPAARAHMLIQTLTLGRSDVQSFTSWVYSHTT